jgi:hypothetical protein
MLPALKTADLEQYKKGGYNVLLPSSSIQQVSEFHELTLEEVRLELQQDAYPQDHEDEPDKAHKWALNKVGLMKLSHCAGISWNWSETRSLKLDRDYVCFQAVGALQRSDGRWIPFKATYELDLEIVEEELRQLYTSKARHLKIGRGPNERPANEKEKADYIERSVKRELLRKRKHKLRLAETGAMLAVVRGLLAIKATYNREELGKPFVVPRIVFRPDMSDPEIRRAVMVSGVKAIEQAYGSSPAPTYHEPPIEIPHGDIERSDAPEETNVDGAEKPETKQTVPAAAKEGASGGLPFSVPQEQESVVKSVAEFKALEGEDRVKALRRLMAVKKYPEAGLRNPDIGKWSNEDQEKFCLLLISLKDKN